MPSPVQETRTTDSPGVAKPGELRLSSGAAPGGFRATEEIAAFADVPLNVNVELDRRVMTVRDLLRLDLNSVLKMNRSAGENLDVRIGGAVIGCGEIVISETTTGVRITDFDLKE